MFPGGNKTAFDRRHVTTDTIFFACQFAFAMFIFGFEPAHQMTSQAFALWIVTTKTDIAKHLAVFSDGVRRMFAPHDSDDHALAFFVLTDVTGSAGNGFFLHHRIKAGIGDEDRLENIVVEKPSYKITTLILHWDVTIQAEPFW